MSAVIEWSDIDSIPRSPASARDLAALKRAGWTVHPTGFATEYKPTWTYWHSLREVVQNSLDETGEFGIVIDRRADGRAMTVVTDDGGGFGARALLLGQRKGLEEKERHLLRGYFGEGMKYAALPVLRAHSRMFIRTVGLDVAFVEAPTTIGAETLLAVHVVARGNDVKHGTSVAIEGLDAEAWMPPKQDEDDPDPEPIDLRYRFVPWIARNRPDLVLATITAQEDAAYEKYGEGKVRHLLALPGQIFVRDIYVQQRERALFGYNLWFGDVTHDKPLDPDRDRLAVSSYDDPLKWEAGRVLGGLQEPALTQFLLALRQSGERQHAYDWSLFDSFGVREGVSRAQATRLYAAVRNVEGTDRITFENERDKTALLEYHGYVNLAGKYPEGIGWTLYHYDLIVKPPAILRGMADARIKLTREDLVAFFDTVCVEPDKAEAAISMFDTALGAIRTWLRVLVGMELARQLEVVLFIEPPKDNVTAGYYTGSEIGINVGTLDYQQVGSIAETVIHEASHAYTDGADDLTVRFERALASRGVAFARWAAENSDEFTQTLDAVREVRRYGLPGYCVIGPRRVGSEFVNDTYAGLLARGALMFFADRLPVAPAQVE